MSEDTIQPICLKKPAAFGFCSKYTEIIQSEGAAQENSDRDPYKTANRAML